MNRLLASLLVLTLGLAACAEAPSPGGGGTGQGPALRGVTWILDGSSVALLGGGSPGQARGTIRFDPDGAGGTAFCNLYGARYTVGDDGAMTIEPQGMTEMACEERLMSLEAAFIDALGEVTSYRFDGDTLVLVGDVELRFEKEEPLALVGTAWRLDGISAGGDTVTSVLPDTEVTATFGDDGQMRGNGGCNDYGAGYTLDGSSLKIGDVIMTEIACDPVEVLNQELAFVDALGKVASFEIEGSTLTLMDASGDFLLSFVGESD